MLRNLFILSIISLFTCPVLAEEPVHIPDANLKAAIESQLGITDPTATDMLELFYLKASNLGISDLTGIEYAVNLNELDLGSNYISDISPLRGLTGIKALRLWYNQIVDISPLSKMVNLEWLALVDNKITDISPLAGLTKISDLGLGWNKIIDISPLANLVYLQNLWIAHNQISDISPLLNLTNLAFVNIPENQLSTKSFEIYIPIIISNNPGIDLRYDSRPYYHANNPQPANFSKDILQDITISWTHGDFAVTHNVFLGTDFKDVNNAMIDYPLGTTVYQNLNRNSIRIENLKYDTTYYWRVDEVNLPSKPFIYKGYVWQFKIESYMLKIKYENLTATAISSYRSNNPYFTIDEIGLDIEDTDLHSNNLNHMWLSNGKDTESVWIKYEFDQAYELQQMLVWNYNNSFLEGSGFRNVKIEYSLDDVNWTELPGVHEFAQAPIANGYKYNTIVDFNGILAKYIRLTALSNWSDSTISNCGLSEVRFIYLPNKARNPFPSTSSFEVQTSVTLSWQEGRKATKHNIYLSSDINDIYDSNIGSLITQTSNKYNPLSLDLDCRYYWRVDEVNETSNPSIWPGDIWNFTTRQYHIIDDFEDYNDVESHRVIDIWTDGRNIPENGSYIGYPDPNIYEGEHYLESDLIHNGLLSAPICYDNTIADYSEVSVNIDILNIGSDWTMYMPETLVLWFYGSPDNSLTEQLYIKINNQKILYNTITDILIDDWKQWIIDLTTLNIDLSNITNFSIGFDTIEENGGSGIIYIDDIRLYQNTPKENIWIESETANTIEPPLIIYNDLKAFGGQYISVISGNNSMDNPPSPNGTASYIFEASGGTYLLHARLITSFDDDIQSSDSCWIRIAGAELNTTVHSSGWIKWNEIEYSEYWHWETVHNNDDENKIVEFNLKSGTYTLEVGYREDGLLLDSFLIKKIR